MLESFCSFCIRHEFGITTIAVVTNMISFCVASKEAKAKDEVCPCV